MVFTGSLVVAEAELVGCVIWLNKPDMWVENAKKIARFFEDFSKRLGAQEEGDWL